MKFSFETVRGVSLAPMAGVCDSPFRSLCAEFGAAFTVSEMVSAKALSYGDKKSRALMESTPRERPFGIQLFGDDPAVMAEAAAIAGEYKPDFIDINMGCPVPKVAGNGCGAALMKNPGLAERIAKAVVENSCVPVSVKIRSGWDSGSKNAVTVAKAVRQSGVSAVTVHGRTKAQGYAPPVDLEIIREVTKSLDIPVIGNGGIYSALDAARMLEETGCASVMAAQGALGNPFLFEQINAYLKHGVLMPAPGIYRIMETMLRHCAAICEMFGEKKGMLTARKHAAWYIKGINGAARFRREAVNLTSLSDLEKLTRDILYSSKQI